VSLLGFAIGIMVAVFHICGMMFLFSEKLKMLVRYSIARGPRCFRCFMLILSGPVELLFLADFIASNVCCVVIGMWVSSRLWIFLSIVLFELSVLCGVMFVNCLLKLFAISLCVDFILLLNDIVLLGGV